MVDMPLKTVSVRCFSYEIDPIERFQLASTGSVPRDRGVRGAARGLERELKASRQLKKKQD